MDITKKIHPGQGQELPIEEKQVSPRTQSRRVALQALYQWQLNAEEPAIITRQFSEAGLLNDIDMSLFNDLVSQVVNQAEALDEVISPFLDRSIVRIDPVEKTIMRIGAYELQAKAEIPYKVIINECVELAKRFGADESHKYVNGILDKIAQQVRAIEIEG